jgi:hypothetical protein
MPRPQAVDEAKQVSDTPAAQEAEELAPQAHAQAIQLRDRAEAAYQAGDLAGAQILGEHAVAAMSHAFVLARLVKAQKRLDQANQELTRAQSKLAALDEQAQRISAEADNLELRVKVMRDAEPLAATTAASPAREQARKMASRALLSQARLLCLATRLLEPQRKGLDEMFSKLGTLEKGLGSAPSADLEAATKARSDCLRELTLVRRPKLLEAPAEGVGDELLQQLSKTEKFFAFRDDRGVVVVLRDVLGKDQKPTASGSEQLEALARAAKAHPEFPVLVVAHSSGSAEASQKSLAEVVSLLRSKGAPAVEGHNVGDAQPVAQPKRPGASERNERIEIVFVSPAP